MQHTHTAAHSAMQAPATPATAHCCLPWWAAVAALRVVMYPESQGQGGYAALGHNRPPIVTHCYPVTSCSLHGVQEVVVLDPYAPAVLSRRHWGQLAPELPWQEVLGFAATWPQAAGALPTLEPFDWEGECCDLAEVCACELPQPGVTQLYTLGKHFL